MKPRNFSSRGEASMPCTDSIDVKLSGRPLQVYLDSSDYSDMANPRAIKNRPGLEKVRDFLVDSVEKGIIEIRFSAFTLAEIIHVNETYKDSAVQRASFE